MLSIHTRRTPSHVPRPRGLPGKAPGPEASSSTCVDVRRVQQAAVCVPTGPPGKAEVGIGQ